ncbi:MAG: DUF4364 family protein [Oscillospiraceae bacterium]|nr:DUF4364 family protein [Oscillospiraceae bacterium]
MARIGFIQGKLDIKMLTLYVLAHVAAPIDFSTLTDLVMCDDGVDYFLYAEGVAELLENGHAEKKDEFYIATEKGRKLSLDLESSLSPVIRKRCDQRLAPLNAALKRKAQVQSEIIPIGGGNVIVKLRLDDDQGSIFSLSLLAGSEEDGKDIARRFSDHPGRIYNGILGVLLAEEAEENE